VDEHPDRCAECGALEQPGQDLDAVGLLARCREAALAGLAAVEVALDLFGSQREARWARRS